MPGGRRLAVLGILALSFAVLAVAQNSSKSSPGTSNYKQLVESAIQAHVRSYLGDETVPKESLKIRVINGASFDDLKHKLSVGPGGAVEYWGGRAIPDAGSRITIDFLDPSQTPPEQSMIVIEAVADGKGGVKSFEKMDVTEGTQITLKSGIGFTFHGGHWVKK